MDAAVAHLALMARNNACANEILLSACARLEPGEWQAPRTGFFPSLAATLHHVHAIDLYYLDALTGGGLGPGAFREAPVFDGPQALAAAQAAQDRRLIGFCQGLAAGDLAARVVTDRGEAGRMEEAAGRRLVLHVVTDRGEAGRMEERVDLILLHLFQHQIHHRGQAHAMLSGTSVPPPQLDDFYLDFGRVPAATRWLQE